MPKSAGTRPSKRKPCVALYDLDEATNATLAECFRMCDIEPKIFQHSATDIFRQAKFEGCVVDFHADTSESMLKAARSSPSHNRIVLYGISREASEIRTFSRFGINVLIQYPVVRQDALRAIRSTRLLLMNELRRYVRIPLVSPVTVLGPLGSFHATTVEISGGGMSVQLAPTKKLIDGDVRVTFAVPDSAPLTLAGTVCWANAELHRIGIRFDPLAPDREMVKTWIEEYLDLK